MKTINAMIVATLGLTVFSSPLALGGPADVSIRVAPPLEIRTPITIDLQKPNSLAVPSATQPPRLEATPAEPLCKPYHYEYEDVRVNDDSDPRGFRIVKRRRLICE
jgi:hypothetical protein